MDGNALHTALKKRLMDEYFNKYNISTKGNFAMYMKTIILFSLYIVAVYMLFTASYLLVLFFAYILIAVAIAGVGLSVMHDANHHAYSKNRKVNKILSRTMEWFGGNSSYAWDIKHNKDHHSHTNKYGKDGDIDANGMFRFTESEPWLPHHKWQHRYMFPVYCLTNLNWVFHADFKACRKYIELERIPAHIAKREWRIMIAAKLYNLLMFLVLPILVSPFSWWIIVLGFLLMHCIIGLVTTLIFQPAHVNLDTKMFDGNENTGYSMFEEQVYTTANFGMNNKLLTWYAGGLNFQIIHHLFPKICHIHYPKISPIVEDFLKEHHLPYNSYPSFVYGMKAHFEQVKRLSYKPATQL